MLLGHERNYDLGMDALLIDGTHLKTERNYDLGMDALLIARIQKLNGSMIWAWMLC